MKPVKLMSDITEIGQEIAVIVTFGRLSYRVILKNVNFIIVTFGCLWNRVIIIIIMEICKTPTLRLKELNKHNITHIMYMEMENVISNVTKS